MLIWGSRGESKDLGQISTKPCPTCEKERPFHLFTNYRLHHIWYFIKWTTQKKYVELCEVCRRGTEIDNSSPLLAKAKAAIPLTHRYSWLILPVLLLPGIVAGNFADSDRAKRNADLMAAPKVGDTYSVDVSKFVKDFDDKFKYGVMRIKAINGSSIEFQMPKGTFNKLTGANEDMTTRANTDDYYSPSSLRVPLSDLKALSDSGAIHRVRRP